MTDAAPSREPTEHHGASFWLSLAVGVPIIGYGIRGAVTALPGDQLASFVRWFVGAAVVHDFLVAPFVCLVAWGVVRVVPAVAAGPAQGALLASGVVGLVSWPFVRGYGVTPGEPSFLSRDYASSVLTIWAAIWAIAGSVTLLRVVSARRR